MHIRLSDRQHNVANQICLHQILTKSLRQTLCLVHSLFGFS